MLSRCYDTKNLSYNNYGKVGIKVCDRWHCFEYYAQDVIKLQGYNEEKVKSEELSLDKDIINRDAKIYSPETCMWATLKENIDERTKRNAKLFKATRLLDGFTIETKGRRSLAKEYDLNPDSIDSCLRGACKTHKGWKFEYIKETVI